MSAEWASTKRQKVQEIPDRSHRAKEHNNWTEKHPNGAQGRQDEERIGDLEDRTVELTHTKQQKGKNKIK